MFLWIRIKGTPPGGKHIWDGGRKLGSQPTLAEDKKRGKVEIVLCLGSGFGVDPSFRSTGCVHKSNIVN